MSGPSNLKKSSQPSFRKSLCPKSQGSPRPSPLSSTLNSSEKYIYNILARKKSRKNIQKTDIDQMNYILRNSHSPDIVLYNTQRTSIVTLLTLSKSCPDLSNENLALIGKNLIQKMKSSQTLPSINMLSKSRKRGECSLNFDKNRPSTVRLVNSPIAYRTREKTPKQKGLFKCNQSIKRPEKMENKVTINEPLSVLDSHESSISLNGWMYDA